MKLVTFQTPGTAARLGVILADGNHILDVQAATRRAHGQDAPEFVAMQALIVAGPPALAKLRGIVEAAVEADRLAVAAVRLLAPLPRPVQMRDCLAFKQHLVNAAHGRNKAAGLDGLTPAQQQRLDLYDTRPFWYKCNRFAVVGPDVDIGWPSYSQVMDYEHELAIVIGERCVNVAPEAAMAKIFGYTIFNDLSARDVQNDEMAMLGPNKSKDFDGANVLGPCIVTADAFDPADVLMTSYVNGEKQNENRTSTISWSFASLISQISRHETLHPGEIIASGTIGGGCGMEQGRMLNSGDVVALEVEGIGVLRNRIFAANDPAMPIA